MNTNLSEVLLAALLLAGGMATVNAAEPAAAPSAPSAVAPTPGALTEKCKQDPATCRKQAQARFDKRFKKLDTDGDGSLSKAEAEKGAPRLAEHFSDIDTDKDGKLTREEVQTAAREHGERCKQDPEKCRAEMKQRFDAKWKKADVDGDGTVSRAEADKAMPRLAQHFDEIDANKDGKITQDELAAARARHHRSRQPANPGATPSVPKASS